MLSWPVLAPRALAVTLAAEAQVCFTATNSQFDLSETVQIDRADGAALARLERVKACLEVSRCGHSQWDEAVETLRQVSENAEGKLLAAGTLSPCTGRGRPGATSI